MNNPVAKRIQQISPFYVMELLQRAKELEAQGRDIIHMEIGEPDFATPQTILNAGIAHLQSGQVKYTAAAGLPQLRKKIAEFYQQRHDVLIAPERIFVTPGASGALLLALGVSLNPGDELLMADPCYPCNANFAALFQGIAKRIPVDASTQYQLTDDLIQQHWTHNTHAVLLASPSNPTGTMIPAQALQQTINLVNAYGGSFYSDEIYHGLTYGTDATTALKFSQNVFVINSFSKYFGMTGWRIGWLVVPEAYIEATEKLAQNVFIATSTNSQFAALAAFEPETLLELERRRQEFEKRRDFLYQRLIEIGFVCPVKPEGAFYIYANCSKFTDDSFKFAVDLLESEGVAVTPGKDFGNYQHGHHIRFAYTTSIENMEVALNRLERFIKQTQY